MADEKLPGVTLWHRGAKLKEVAGKKSVEMTVVAQINDEAVWKTVEQKFLDGFQVYSTEDFKGHMINAMRMENTTLTSRIAVLETQLSFKDKEITLLNEQLEAARKPLREFGKKLRK